MNVPLEVVCLAIEVKDVQSISYLLVILSHIIYLSCCIIKVLSFLMIYLLDSF
jgi:hypothetical protein